MIRELDRDEQRALVLEVLRHPLSFESLGDGTPGLTVGRLASLTGLSRACVSDALDALVDDGAIERDAAHRYVVTAGRFVVSA